jgi:hypothetical protein
MIYKVHIWNDTGDSDWPSMDNIEAISDEQAFDIALDMWLDDKFGQAAASVDLYAPDYRRIYHFGSGF